jgi:hypothetical protein
MKNWIIKQVVGIQAPKYIRHALAALGAWMASKGFDGDVENLMSLFTGVATILFTVVWSALAKSAPSETWQAVLTTFSGALARQLQTALATWISLDPSQLANGTISTSGVIMIALNILISRLDASDAKQPIELRPDGSRP